MNGIIGGLWLASLISAALFGIVAGAILFGVSCIFISWELRKERQAANTEASWRKQYPPYGY